MKKPPTAAIATACTARRSRKASRPFRKSVRRNSRFFPSPPVGEGGFAKRRRVRGHGLSIDRNPSSGTDFVRATFSHKERREVKMSSHETLRKHKSLARH